MLAAEEEQLRCEEVVQKVSLLQTWFSAHFTAPLEEDRVRSDKVVVLAVAACLLSKYPFHSSYCWNPADMLSHVITWIHEVGPDVCVLLWFPPNYSNPQLKQRLFVVQRNDRPVKCSKEKNPVQQCV